MNNQLPFSIEPDETLWLAVTQGDTKAYNVLMMRYMQPLYHYGQRFLSNKEFIKDAIQDVFLQIWQKRNLLHTAPIVKAYLFKALRARIFRKINEEKSTETLSTAIETFCEENWNIETKLIAHQTAVQQKLKLEKIINSLPKRQKEILYLRFYAGFEHSSIALVMNINRQSVYNLLCDAIQTLRKKWFNNKQTVLKEEKT
jgi:RNA polymerase sigma factor (sigma-70 family)